MCILRIVVAAAAVLSCTLDLDAQNATRGPRAELVAAPRLFLSGEVDSNSPAIWDRVGGRNRLFVMTSASGRPGVATGPQLQVMGTPQPIAIDPWPDGGIWMEAVIKDVDGTWYGYYHNERPARVCQTALKMIPSIGAVRSRDRGLTWEPLGTILEAPPRTYQCATFNEYFVGGVGDFSVMLDPGSRDLYFFFSTYLRTDRWQGIAVARLAWADRDTPVGKIAVWRNRSWIPATSVSLSDGEQRWIYPAAMPLFPTGEPWHDGDTIVDAYWGPSVHWNTHLEQYVMLLNRAKNEGFDQEGIYISFAPSLEDPRLWSPPVRILKGGTWYPQVIGLDVGAGTDKLAGEWARFFMLGTSQHLIHFTR